MKQLIVLALGCIVLAGCSDDPRPVPERGSYKVGVTALDFVDEDRQRPQVVKLWYPADDAAVQRRQNYARLFEGYAAPEASFNTGRRPLVLLSHGDKGSNANLAWLGEWLASHGYIVASVNHWLNTTQHYEPAETIRAWHRPGDVSVVIDRLLADAVWRERIDANTITAIGHSSGGYTVLALAGAVYEPRQIRDYCSGAEAGPSCSLVEGVDLDAIDYRSAGESYRDPSVRAVIALAPALGPAITEASLAAIDIPVYIVTTEDDEVLSQPQNARRYHQHIPGSRLDSLPDGGHFVYYSRCNRIGGFVTRFIEFDICGNNSNVDRAEVRRFLGPRVLAFIEEAGGR